MESMGQVFQEVAETGTITTSKIHLDIYMDMKGLER